LDGPHQKKYAGGIKFCCHQNLCGAIVLTGGSISVRRKADTRMHLRRHLHHADGCEPLFPGCAFSPRKTQHGGGGRPLWRTHRRLLLRAGALGRRHLGLSRVTCRWKGMLSA
jgi:hypothetical protein